jgi:glycosyltransferase involved in cell wall biosynthesis
MKNKISVIIPTYNRAHTLPRALQSVRNQNYDNIEIIVVDDFSNDNTELLMSKAENADIRYISHNQNFGPAAARNTGIKSATGEYIAFLDSDDIWLPNKLSFQLEILIKNGCKICGTQSIKINEDKQEIIPQWYPEHIQAKSAALVTNMFLNTSSLIIERNLLNDYHSFDTSLTCFEDWDLLLRLGEKNKIVVTKDLHTISYISSNNVSILTEADKKAFALAKILKQHKNTLIQNKTELKRLLHFNGQLYKASKQKTKSAACFYAAIKVSPFSPATIKNAARLIFLPFS